MNLAHKKRRDLIHRKPGNTTAIALLEALLWSAEGDAGDLVAFVITPRIAEHLLVFVERRRFGHAGV